MECGIWNKYIKHLDIQDGLYNTTMALSKVRVVFYIKQRAYSLGSLSLLFPCNHSVPLITKLDIYNKYIIYI